MNSDNFIFEKDNRFGHDMINRISKEMGITPICIDKIIVTVRYNKPKQNGNRIKK